MSPVKWAYNNARDLGGAICRQALPPRQKLIVLASSLHHAALVFCAVRTAHYQLTSLRAPRPRCKPPEIKRRQLLAPRLPMRSLATGETGVVCAELQLIAFFSVHRMKSRVVRFGQVIGALP